MKGWSYMNQKKALKDMTVIGTCDANLYAFWCAVHNLEDSFVFEKIQGLSKEALLSWVSFVNAVDDAFTAGTFGEGEISTSVVFFFTSDT